MLLTCSHTEFLPHKAITNEIASSVESASIAEKVKREKKPE